MSSFFSTENIINMLYMLVPIVLSLSVHEYAHAFIAYKMGDPTAKDCGRMTLNPIKHLDPVGFLALLLFKFGWANPVPINPNNFKNRKTGTILVSLAGPISNLLMAIIFSLLLKFIVIPLNNVILYYICAYGVVINIYLMVFNFIPVPPLDGSKVLISLLPFKYEMKFYEYERYLYFILILLLVTGGITTIMSPITSPLINILL